MAAAEELAASAAGPPAASAKTGLGRVPPEANLHIARMFVQVAEWLEADDMDLRRARAYRLAAQVLRRLPQDIRSVANAGGSRALVALPHIGQALAAEILEILETGRLRLLERFKERACPRATLAGIPGIGPKLARRITDNLRIESLEDLEAAAHDGRLAEIPGFGVCRVRDTRRAIAHALTRHPAAENVARPPAALLIKLDARYRKLVESNQLRKIAPRRFNPTHKAWLPILECEQDGWHFTLMYSNTARAHRLGKTKDWVIACYERRGLKGSSTVVTESRGAESGYRVVRGRELSCHRYYRAHPQRPTRLPTPLF